jgi:hypothetical protein
VQITVTLLAGHGSKAKAIKTSALADAEMHNLFSSKAAHIRCFSLAIIPAGAIIDLII